MVSSFTIIFTAAQWYILRRALPNSESMTTSATQLNVQLAPTLLPVLCALLIVSHTEFIMLKLSSGTEYLSVCLHNLAKALPLILAHVFCFSRKGAPAWVIWTVGFVGYPLALLVAKPVLGDEFAQFVLSTDNYLVFLAVSSLTAFASRLSHTDLLKRWLHLSSIDFLNLLIIIGLVCWVVLMALATSVEDGIKVSNTALQVTINIVQVDVSEFMLMLCQLSVIAATLWLIYVANLRFLISTVLTRYGVFIYLCSTLSFLLLVTPIAFSVIFFLPVSEQDLLFVPHHGGGLFQSENYVFMFWLIALTTPLLLIFRQQQRETRFAQLTTQNTRTELLLLQQQLNPHFLFNVLNNLYGKVLTKSDDAPLLLDHLASLLRHSVYKGQQSWVKLNDELDYLNHFIELQRSRSRENLKLSIDFSQCQHSDLRIAPLLLIVPVENAFKHSVELSPDESDISIECKCEGSRFFMHCENTLHPRNYSHSKQNSGGVGLKNLVKRLQLIYPNKHQFRYGPQGNVWTVDMSVDLSVDPD